MHTNERRNDGVERITLHRGGAVVSSLMGAFGGALRETRLTAMLGYLIALTPSRFESVFRLDARILSVTLEANYERDRADIVISTTRGDHVIEAKTIAGNPRDQIKKYKAAKYLLLTNYAPGLAEKRLKHVSYLSWRRLGEVLQSLAKGPMTPAKLIALDLKKYLEEYHMLKKQDSVEIYAREINEEKTLNLFLKARLYGCRYERSSRLPEAKYFAPHFGKSIANSHPGIGTGISYVASIENVEVVDDWQQLLGVTKKLRQKPWLNAHMKFLEELHKSWSWNQDKYSFLYLGEPHLVFNPPIKKERLQKGRGWLSKRIFTFEDLFSAWTK